MDDWGVCTPKIRMRNLRPEFQDSILSFAYGVICVYFSELSSLVPVLRQQVSICWESLFITVFVVIHMGKCCHQPANVAGHLVLEALGQKYQCNRRLHERDIFALAPGLCSFSRHLKFPEVTVKPSSYYWHWQGWAYSSGLSQSHWVYRDTTWGGEEILQ